LSVLAALLMVSAGMVAAYPSDASTRGGGIGGAGEGRGFARLEEEEDDEDEERLPARR
jgi:hypothetical protein